MKSGSGDPGLAGRLALIATITATMVLMVLMVDRTYVGGRAAGPVDGAKLPWVAATGETPPAIAREAAVFTARERFASDTVHPRRTNAHPRTLSTFRALRGYPGAPPRVPHGVTVEEYREERCNACHGTGGFSPRFGAYAPVTPHAGMPSCLQCHLVDGSLVGLALPGPSADADCRQCHSPGSPKSPSIATDWIPASWPALAVRGQSESPPVIPHDLELRGNCYSCHAGPGAVREIRTSHPDRPDCRQCHLSASGAEAAYARSPSVAAVGPGVTR
jgi:nitrate reductase (cytochrome), electron transfer subunit